LASIGFASHFIHLRSFSAANPSCWGVPQPPIFSIEKS
jgi:hypothetical protein